VTEEETRALVQEEIRFAFAKLVELADGKESGMWYSSGYDAEQAACRMIRDVANAVVQELTPTEPEPANPFAPKYTAQEWADRIRAVASEAEADGYAVWIDNACCGCSKMTLQVGEGNESARVIGEPK